MNYKTRKNSKFSKREDGGRSAFKGEKVITPRFNNMLTGEVHSTVQPTHIQNNETQSQYVNFLFKEMIYQPYGNGDFTTESPINLFSSSVLDTAINSTTRNSTSNRAINTWKERFTYLDTVAKAYAFYCSMEQWIKYYYEPTSMNYGVNYTGRRHLIAEVLNAHERLGILLKMHSMPLPLQKICQDLFRWRMAGDSGEAAVIGLTTIHMSDVNNPEYLVEFINSLILQVEDLVQKDAENDFVCANIQTTLNKQGIDWSIKLPEYSGVLSYEKEYLTLFLHTPTSRGATVFPSMPDTYSFIEGELTPFTCAHIMDPNWKPNGLLAARLYNTTGMNYTVSKNTDGGFDRVIVGNTDIAKKVLGLPAWYVQTNGSGVILPAINLIPGGKLIRGVTQAQRDMIQHYLKEVYMIDQLSQNHTKKVNT